MSSFQDRLKNLTNEAKELNAIADRNLSIKMSSNKDDELQALFTSFNKLKADNDIEGMQSLAKTIAVMMEGGQDGR